LAKKPTYKVRSVRTKEERKRPSVFMRLKTGEALRGYAMFEPDPEMENNPGYYEYYSHYDAQANQYVPCAGERCPFCAANDNPSTKALTVFYMPDEEKGEQLKVFTMNFSTVEATADESEDEDGIIGKKLRLKRLTDKGEYRVKTLSDKPLNKTEMKKVMVEVEDLNLPGIVDRQLQVQMERLRALDALEDEDVDDDEDDEEEAKPSRRRGKAISKDEATTDDEEAEEEEDEDEEDEEAEEEDVDEEDENEEEEDEEDEDEDEEDEDEDAEEEDEEEEDEEEQAEISKAAYEVVKVNKTEETLELKGEDGTSKMWVGDGVEIDFDAMKKGTKVVLSALEDDEGDLVITDLEVQKAPARRSSTTKKTTPAKPKATTRTRRK